MQWLTPWSDPTQTSLYLMMVYFAGYFALRTLVIFTPLYIWSRRAARRVYRAAARPSSADVIHAARSFVVDVVMLSVMVKSDIARIDESHWLSTAFASFVVLEIWFYAFHRALHHPKLFFIHRAHHGSRTIDPLTGMAFSVLERTGIILGFAAGIGALSFVYPIAPSGIALYFLFNYTLNMIGHSNVEVFSPSLRWIVTPTHHAMHHARYDGHYGLHLTFLDLLFKTEFSDYRAVHARVWSGQSLTEFAQRCEPVDLALAEMRAGTRPLDAKVDGEALRPRLLLDLPATRRWLEPRIQTWLTNGVANLDDSREWYTWAPLNGPLTASEISQLVLDGALAPDRIVFSPDREGALRAGELPAPVLNLRPHLYVNRRQPRSVREMHVLVERADVLWSGLTTNVSRQGAALVLDSRAPLLPGDIVTLRCGELSLVATVVTVQALESTLRCALEFNTMRSRERNAWEKVLRASPETLSA